MDNNVSAEKVVFACAESMLGHGQVVRAGQGILNNSSSGGI